MAKLFAVDDIVEILICRSGHNFEIGEHVRIKHADYIGYKAEHLDGRDYWYLDLDEVGEIKKEEK